MFRSAPMKRTGFKPKVKPTAGILRTANLAEAKRFSSFKRKSPKKRAGHDKSVRDTCAGQRCYVAPYMPEVACSEAASVVPAHSNELALGKGMGLKVPDIYTVPCCGSHHYELDQGNLYDKDRKKAAWRSAYADWAPVREQKFGVPYQPLPEAVCDR